MHGGFLLVISGISPVISTGALRDGPEEKKEDLVDEFSMPQQFFGTVHQ